MKQGFALWNQSYAKRGEPVHAKPLRAGSCPALDRTSGFAFRSTYAKRSQTKTGHFTCYLNRTS